MNTNVEKMVELLFNERQARLRWEASSAMSTESEKAYREWQTTLKAVLDFKPANDCENCKHQNEPPDSAACITCNRDFSNWEAP